MKRTAASLALLCAASAAMAQSTEGEVRKIDKEQARITLKHGAIKNLDMPPMTMVFRLRDAKMLESINVGDKVKFDAAKIDGQYVIITLRPLN